MTTNTGIKYDEGKAELSMISATALTQLAKVLSFGAQKYERNNWRKGMNWDRLINATLRHVLAFNEGQDLDPETGLNHLSHAMCNLMMLIEYYYEELGTDTRYKVEDKGA